MSTKRPVTLRVTLERLDKGRCTFIDKEGLNEKVLREIKVDTLYYPESFMELERVQRLVSRQLETDWLFNSYKLQVREFAFKVVKEVISQESGLIHSSRKLKKLCHVIVHDNRPSTTLRPSPTLPKKTWPERYPNEPFNEVDEQFIGRFLGKHLCLEKGRKRVYIGKYQLSESYPKSFQIKDLELSDGKAEQRITLNEKTELEIGVLTEWYFIVRIPCVVPYIIYNYKYSSLHPLDSGEFIIENIDQPRMVQITFFKQPDGNCYLIDWTLTDGQRLAGFSTVLRFIPRSGDEETPKQRLTPADVKTWWQKDFKAHMVQFVYLVLKEAVNPKGHILKNGGDLCHICSDIFIYGQNSTTPAPTERSDEVWPDDGWPPADDQQQFIEVDVRDVERLVGRHQCLQITNKRVYVSTPQLSNNYLKDVQYKDLKLTDGSVEQRISVSKGTTLEISRSKKNHYTVFIPCMVPAVLFLYSYSMSSNQASGRIRIDMVGKPQTLQVIIEKDGRDCTFVEGSVTDIFKEVLWIKPSQNEETDVREVVRELIQGWKVYYKAQIVQFAYAMVKEALSQTAGVIQRNRELERICRHIKDKPGKMIPVPITRSGTQTQYMRLMEPSQTVCHPHNDWPEDQEEWPNRDPCKPFNSVSSREVENVIGRQDCLQLNEERIYIGRRQFPGYYKDWHDAGALKLSNGLVNQRITISRDTSLSVIAVGNGNITIQINCVVPIVLFLFQYHIQYTRSEGKVRFEVSDGPLELLVNLQKEDDGTCSIMAGSIVEGKDDGVYKVAIHTIPHDPSEGKKEEEIEVHQLMKKYITGNALHDTFKAQMEEFAFMVIKEAVEQVHNVIQYSQDLNRHCKLINENPRTNASSGDVIPRASRTRKQEKKKFPEIIILKQHK
ncbi:hypothetical protein J6590_029712 [Homalodisca vitripennis]|nr:hypothetical protein J6590_029712 [Homalodisca vitripennis]